MEYTYLAVDRHQISDLPGQDDSVSIGRGLGRGERLLNGVLDAR